MRYFELAKIGDNGLMKYIGTILLLASTLIGFGQLPLMIALMFKGISVNDMQKMSAVDIRLLLGNNMFIIVQLIPFIILLVFLLFAVRKLHNRPILTLFTTRPEIDFKRILFAFGTWSAFLFFSLFLSKQTGAELKWNFSPNTFLMLVGISFFIIPLQTTFEELFFRGYLIQSFGRRFKAPLFPMLMSGVIFGLMHYSNPEVKVLGSAILGYYILIGIFTSLMAVMDEGIELGIGFHAANNIFGCLIVTNHWQVFQTDALWMDMSEPKIGLDLVVTLLIFFPLMLFIFAKKYKWKSLRQGLLTKVSDSH
jgi:membrane protease YdiL (CAAX protease family)